MWMKNGKKFAEPLVREDGYVTYNPTPEMLRDAGYEWQAPTLPAEAEADATPDELTSSGTVIEGDK